MLRIEVSCRTFLHKQFIKNIFMKRLKNITFYNLCIIIYLYQVSDQKNNYDISGMAEAIFAHRVAKER